MHEDFIRRLVEADDPISETWKILVELWDVNMDINEYFRQEDVASEFERELNSVFFEVYGYLYEQIKKASIKAKLPLIIVDGMSIREGNLLSRDLKENGYKIIEYNYSVSALPSNTQSFRKRMATKFIEIKSGELPSELDFSVPIWISYPDQILHHAAGIIPPPEAYEKTKKLLLQILGKIRGEEATIVSDHGYIMLNSVWPLASSDRKFLKEHVFGNNRYTKRDEIDGKYLTKLNKIPKDISYVFINDYHCYIRGRYFWPVGGYSKVAHGGLSLMECLVPRIKVRV